VSKLQFHLKASFRFFAAVLGVGLLAHLMLRTGPQTIWQQVHAVGVGVALIIVLGGISHVLKTWAWRLTFTCDIGALSWPRSFGMRLISEAIAQIGVAGKVLGEGVRVSLLGSAAPVANGISSGALDSGLHILTGAMITVSGIMTALLVAPATGKWRFWAILFAGILMAFVAFVGIAIGKGWRFASNAARAIGRVPRFQKWISEREAVIESAEECLLTFHREAPRAFWASLALNFAVHALAILEVYIVLKFMGARVTLIAALALEGLTKLINLAGSLNPGNVGTYEGGNMLITKLFGITATSGFTLALCRRARAIFWAAIGAGCLMLMKRARQQNKTNLESNPHVQGGNGDEPKEEPKEEAMNADQQKHSQTVIILADCEQNPARFSPSLARVGTLPILMRAILSVRGTRADRIIVAGHSGQAQLIRATLRQTGRMPASVKFRELGQEMDLSSLICYEAATSESVTIVLGDRTYQPQLLQSAIEWKGTGALALATDRELAGIYVLPQSAALDVFGECGVRAQTLAELHSCMQARGLVVIKQVPAEMWHNVVVPEDLPEAERKLNTWLVKPTDGLFACMNRRISIPISRQLIKLPLTPNMVTMLVLGVSFSSGAFFARGGYWSTLLGAFLSVAASVLDGCDGEVARLKLQSTRFGCWLETVCDYLYYLFVFGGMTIGLTRSSGNRIYLAWGVLLCFGALMSFLACGYIRQRFSRSHPEKFLAIWQKKVESQSSNPLLFLGRHTEFIIRRCFFPYSLLFFAIVNLTNVAFVATALGANLVWVIALYSCVALSTMKRSRVAAETGAALSQQATT
jgi:phosphatidylglycerophosphate synthase